MLGQPSLQYRYKMAFLLAFINSALDTAQSLEEWSFQYLTNALGAANTAIDVIVTFILAMIATIIGVNLIGPVATAVGGALNNKNLTGAANSLTAQITLLFVVVVIIGVVIFIAVLGKLASHEAA